MKNCILFLVLSVAYIKAEHQRIVGGSPVTLAAYPYATSLLTNGGSGTQYNQACGGSILTSSAVLSAASCFYTNGTADLAAWWRARVGSAISTQSGTIHFIRLITPHPQFSPTTRANDLAVLRTTLNIDLAANAAGVARIAGRGLTLTTNQPITAIGWGLTANGGQPSEQLREVQFWVIDQQTCGNRYAELGFSISEGMVCTGWLDVGALAQCVGDAGSPILIDGVVVGVHSWVEGCGDGWYPGVNTLVGAHTNWIVDTALAA